MKLKFTTLNEKINASIQCHRLIKELEQIGLSWFLKITPLKKLTKQLDEEIDKERHGIK